MEGLTELCPKKSQVLLCGLEFELHNPMGILSGVIKLRHGLGFEQV
jgi:hypothetical protein